MLRVMARSKHSLGTQRTRKSKHKQNTSAKDKSRLDNTNRINSNLKSMTQERKQENRIKTKQKK